MTRAVDAWADVMPFAANIDDLVLADAETDPHSLPPLVGAGPGVGARGEG